MQLVQLGFDRNQAALVAQRTNSIEEAVELILNE